MQTSIISENLVAVSVQQKSNKRQEMLLFISIVCIAFGLTLLLVWIGVKTSFLYTLGGLLALVLVAIIARWPLVGVYCATGCALLVEDNFLPQAIPTGSWYVFYWPTGLEGLFERPIGFVFLTILFTCIFRHLLKRQQVLRGGKLFLPYLFYLLCVGGGVLYGLASGGNLKVIVVEVRPFWYLFIAYLLSYNLITKEKHIRVFFWLVIVCGGLKALQGLYIYLVEYQGDLTGHDSIMSHEESFFFAAFVILFVLFCLHYRSRKQWSIAFLLLPCVLVVFLANQRRADYIALLVGIMVVWVLVFWTRPETRFKMIVGMLICVVLGTGYVLAFANSNGSFGKPARAVVSVFNPGATDSRNANSNLYRLIENGDLKYTVRKYPLGLGFGKPFLQPIPLTSIFPQIQQFDIYYNYIPHNNIYWVWMRLGPIGYFAFWYLFGAVIVRGSLLARTLRDPYLQLTAIFVVAVTFMEVIVAFADYQLYFYRNVIYLGLLFGILMKLSAFDEKKEMTHV